MSVTTAAGWPDDPQDDQDDFDDLDFDYLDSSFDDDDEDDDDEDGDDELGIEFGIDRRTGRIAHIYTRGLWADSIPELSLAIPSQIALAPGMERGSLSVFLTAGMIQLSDSLLAADHFKIEPYQGEFEGRPASLWLDRQEPPTGGLAAALGSEVDTVFRVGCSLWQQPPPDLR